jgi:hypothetical protein
MDLEYRVFGLVLVGLGFMGIGCMDLGFRLILNYFRFVF